MDIIGGIAGVYLIAGGVIQLQRIVSFTRLFNRSWLADSSAVRER